MTAPGPSPPRLALVAAFAAVYVIWGSTYLAIRIAIETLPPFLMAGARFLVAGSLLYAWGLARGARRPTRRHWRNTAVAGALLLLGGNGAVVWAEQWVPSGLVALLVATVPLWMVTLDWGWGGGGRPRPAVVGGLVWGLAGVALLTGAPGTGAGGVMELVGCLVVLGGSFSWAAGSIYSRRAELPESPRVTTGMEMLQGGALLLLLAVVTGELRGFDPGAVTLRSWVALAYLVVFGAVVGFTAYVWLLRVSTPARVATYAYVNPVVALFLGWALASEPLTPRTLTAAAVILTAVMLITVRRRPLAPRRPPATRPAVAGD